MTLIILNKCKKHKRLEEKIIFFDKNMKTYGCLPACRECMKKDKNYVVYKNWKDVIISKKNEKNNM